MLLLFGLYISLPSIKYRSVFLLHRCQITAATPPRATGCKNVGTWVSRGGRDRTTLGDTQPDLCGQGRRSVCPNRSTSLTESASGCFNYAHSPNTLPVCMCWGSAGVCV